MTLASDQSFFHSEEVKQIALIISYLFLQNNLCFAQTHDDTQNQETKKYAQIQIPSDALFSPFPIGFPAPPNQAEGWYALPPSRPFPSLPTDPRDLKIAFRKLSNDNIEADVGGYRSFAGWKGEIQGKTSIIHIGIEGNAYFTMQREGVKFPLESSDGLFGIYAEAIRGKFLYQFRFTHISAHLSDGIFGKRERFSYSRESAIFRIARQISWFRPYFGYHWLVNSAPELSAHSFQIGFYAIPPIHWGILHPYFGFDYKDRTNGEEGNALNITAGIAIVSKLGAPPIRLIINHFQGHDPRGQFFRETVKLTSYGFELDF